MWWPLHHGHLTWLSRASALAQCHQLSSVTPATHTQTYHVYSLVAKELGYWTNNILWIWIPGPWRATQPFTKTFPTGPTKATSNSKHDHIHSCWFNGSKSYGLYNYSCTTSVLWPVKSYDFGLKLQTATSALSLVTGYLSLVTSDRSLFKDDHHGLVQVITTTHHLALFLVTSSHHSTW